MEMNRIINAKPAEVESRDPDAPSWWHGDEAALVEAQNFQSWVNNVGRR